MWNAKYSASSLHTAGTANVAQLLGSCSTRLTRVHPLIIDIPSASYRSQEINYFSLGTSITSSEQLGYDLSDKLYFARLSCDTYTDLILVDLQICYFD